MPPSFSRQTFSRPSSVSASAAISSVRAGSFCSGGAEASSSICALPRKAEAMPSDSWRMRSMIRAVTARSKVRTVPSSTASSGMMLGACPA